MKKPDNNEAPSAKPGQTPYERFAEFARKIVAVPKAEVQEQERLYRERRATAAGSAPKQPTRPKGKPGAQRS